MRCSRLGILSNVFLILILISLDLSTVACNGTMYVYIHKKDQPSPWIGKWFNGYYAGAVYVDLRDTSKGNVPSGETALAYCIKYDGAIYTGTEYPVQLTPTSDTSEWRSIAYILTWYHPPINNDMGVCVQGALWKLLPPYIIPSFIPSSYHSTINNLVTETTSKDVVRKGDLFEWIYPFPGNNTYLTANPGETITLKAKITDNGGNPRSGVKVEFSITGGGSLNTNVGWTGSDGVVQVQVTVPNTVADVEVKASTKGVWPQKFIDLYGDKQDLLGIDTTYMLTVTTKLWIFTYIHVVPEIPFGTFVAIVACFFAYTMKTKTTRTSDRSINVK